LILQFGATVDMVDFEYIVFIGEREIIRKFIDRGADLVTGYPIAKGLIRLTRLFPGIYKSNIEKHPELQFQADMALRHFCGEANLPGVSLLMWFGANQERRFPACYLARFMQPPLTSEVNGHSPQSSAGGP
jgi:hypothetical protein